MRAKNLRILLAGLLMVPGVALAAPQKPAEAVSQLMPRAKIFQDLFAQLRDAPDAQSAAQLRGLIASLWAHHDSPTADVLMMRAEAALRGAEQRAAAMLLDRMVSLYPDWSQAWRRRAQSALAQGDFEGARIDLEHALSAEPRDFRAMRQLAELLRDTGQQRAALKWMRRELELDPRNEELRKATEQLEREAEGLPI